MKKLLFLTILFIAFILATPASFAQINQQSADTSIVLHKYFLTNPDVNLEEVITHDLNQDGYIDLIYRTNVYATDTTSQKRTIKFLPGTQNGFDTTNIATIVEDPSIGKMFVGDWNGDSHSDLIVQKSRHLGGGSYTFDVIQIMYLNKTEITNTASFRVPYQIYLGNESNPKMLQQLVDMDLDGKMDMLLTGFSHVTIGWNNGVHEPVFDEITNEGHNTYNSIILDYNQDGYPDFINDDQYVDYPVVHINNRGRTFLPKKSLGLPDWNVENPSSMYWGFEAFWLNEDHFPDLLTRRAGNTGDGSIFESVYEIYEYDTLSSGYSSSDLQFTGDRFGEITPFHFNNDGYVDFVDIKEDTFKIWINDQNISLNPIVLNVETGYDVKNLFKLDFDGDGDLDVFFSFPEDHILYQIENKSKIANEAPSTPKIDSLSVEANEVSLAWTESFDDKSLPGHLDYQLKLHSNNTVVDVNVHSNKLDLTVFGAGEYFLTLSASDPLDLKSDSVETYSFAIVLPGIESEHEVDQFQLHQNYPNPFNPSTVISYQLAGNSLVRLEVFDVTGRKVATLVDGERKSAGTHRITFDADGLSSGVYFYRLETGGQTFTQKMMLVK